MATLPPLPRTRAAGYRPYPNGQNQINPLETPPVDGNYKYRPGRGYVHQIGQAPRVNADGLTQAEQNKVDYLNPATDAANWRTMFPKAPQANPPAPATALVTPPQPAAPATPQAAWSSPLAWDSDTTSPTAPPTTLPATPGTATAAPQPNLTPQSTPYGTVTPMHTWQQSITAKYPAIGQPGSPQNQAFIQEFHKHGDPQRAMETADQIMGGKTAQGTPMPGMVNEGAVNPYL